MVPQIDPNVQYSREQIKAIEVKKRAQRVQLLSECECMQALSPGSNGRIINAHVFFSVTNLSQYNFDKVYLISIIIQKY
jgi:hypothetical protein